MTVAEYLTEITETHSDWEVQFRVGESCYTASELLRGLDSTDAARPIATETGTHGCFLLDADSQQRLLEIVWSPRREGWLPSAGWAAPRAHYYISAGYYLSSLCGIITAGLDSQLDEYPPPDLPVCKTCARVKHVRRSKADVTATQTI